MYGSRSTLLALTIALGAITLGRTTTAFAQTTVPAQTSASADTTSGARPTPTGGVTQQALDDAALGGIRAL